MQPSFAALWIRSLAKADLHLLIDDVKRGDAGAISRTLPLSPLKASVFGTIALCAKLCRHFKNHPPPQSDCDRMVAAITKRLVTGQFSQQFRDQLSMAIRLSPDRLDHAASVAANSDRDYIRRYAGWVRHVLETSSAVENRG